MATNLLLLYPELFVDALLTSSHSYSATRPYKNLWSGGRGDYAELATATPFTSYIEADHDANLPTGGCKGIAICRARLLRASGVSSVVVRCSGIPHNYPGQVSNLQLWIDPRQGVTATAGGQRVSSIVERSSNGFTGSQATDANRFFYSNMSNEANALLYSEDFSASLWTATAVTVTTNVITDPLSDASQIGDLMVESGAASQHGVSATFETQIVGAVSYRISCYIKKRDRRWVFLEVNAPCFAATRVWFDLDNGTIGSNPGGLTATMTAVGNGWYRCVITATSNASSTGGTVGIYQSNADNVASYAGDGTSGTYIFGASVQDALADNSYQKTENGSRHRGLNSNRCLWAERGRELDFGNPAALSITGNMSVFGVIRPKWDGVSTYNLCHHHSLNANGWRFYIDQSGGLFYLRYQASQAGTNQIVTSTTPLSIDTTYRVGFTKSGTTITFYVNGSSAGSGSATNPVAPTTNFKLGLSTAGFNGHIGEFVLYNKTLSAGEITNIDGYLSNYTDSSAASLFAIHNIQTRSLEGTNSEDIFESSTLQANRYYRLEFDSESSSVRRCGHIYLGAGFDFGRDPMYGRTIEKRLNRFLNKNPREKLVLKWEGVTNTQRDSFETLIGRFIDSRTIVLLDQNDINVLLGESGTECEVLSYKFKPTEVSKNTLKLEVEETI